MSDVVIKVENLAKAYRIGLKEQKSDSLGAAIASWVKTPGKNFKNLKNLSNINVESGDEDIFWALKDISFDVKQGEILGIIGKNGAGKSTLLKILSKITDPTIGEIHIRGRVAALLEVGTGFNPDLTGRENTYLNGTILGMTRREIDKKFDEIVDFSGVEKFIDTPVKRYSSGMKVRLGFAVAAYLEPEILIVDEVLAVGDAEFQKKCLGKMQNVSATEGRTVIFVSHNMAAVKQLCNKGIVLAHGKFAFEGTALEAANFYQSSHDTDSSFEHKGAINDAPGNENIRILKFEVLPLQGDSLTVSSGIEFELQFYNYKAGINLDATFELKNMDEVTVFHHGALVTANNDSKTGIYTVKGSLPPYYINAGTYHFNFIFGESQRYLLFKLSEFVQFEILNETLGSNSSILPGVLRPNIDYQISFQ